MFKRNVGLLAWTAGAVVILGVAAGASAVVPSLVSSESTPAAISSESTGTGASATVETPAEVAVAAPAPEVTVPEVVPEAEAEAEVVVTPPPTTKAPKAVVQAAEVVAPAPVLPPVPALPFIAPRTVPSPAQVQSAIAGITGLVQLPLFFSITPAHVADVGNKVCTAFDQGQTFTDVKAVGLAQVAAYVPVSAAAADYAVRTSVAMYCPAYTPKLV